MSPRSTALLLLALALVALAAYTYTLREPTLDPGPPPIIDRYDPDLPTSEVSSPAGSGAPSGEVVTSSTTPAAAARNNRQLEGRIVDTQGAPIAGIPIYLRTLDRDQRGFFMRSTASGEDGGFRLDGLEAKRRYNLFTEEMSGWPGYRIDAFTVAELPAPFEIVLERYALTDLEGTVVDLESLPIPGFTLSIGSLTTDIHARTVTSDASGQFRVPDFPAGELRVFTAAPDYFRIQGLRADEDAYRHLTLVIDRGPYTFAGRVLDPAGEPLANTRITLNSVVAGLEYYSHAYRTRLTDADGRFAFERLGGIPHTLGVYANGYRPLLRKIEFQSFTDDIEIRLRR